MGSYPVRPSQAYGYVSTPPQSVRNGQQGFSASQQRVGSLPPQAGSNSYPGVVPNAHSHYGRSGLGYTAASPALAGVDARTYDQLRGWFNMADRDHNGSLSAEELQAVLHNGDWSPFNAETVRLMISLFDRNASGVIEFNEFTALWQYINEWKQRFREFDRDHSGTIDGSEFRTALRAFGYNLSDRFIVMMVQKFDKHGRGDITFDNFIQACVTIKSLTGMFKRFDLDLDGWITISYEQFLEMVINHRVV